MNEAVPVKAVAPAFTAAEHGDYIRIYWDLGNIPLDVTHIAKAHTTCSMKVSKTDARTLWGMLGLYLHVGDEVESVKIESRRLLDALVKKTNAVETLMAICAKHGIDLGEQGEGLIP